MTLPFKCIQKEDLLKMLFNPLLMRRLVIYYNKFEGEIKEAYIYMV